jgi:hypothetical protein
MQKSNPPVLRHIANLWTLWDHPDVRRPWSVDRQLAAIREAGFDGITYALDGAIGRLAEKHGLITIGYFASSGPADFRRLIQQNIDGGARRINVQLGDHDTPPEKAVEMAVRVIAEGERQGMPCDIEVHRDTCTETPEKTRAIAAGYKKATGRLLPMTWDFSHLAVVKHLMPPYADRLLTHPALVRHAAQFHFRPFNGHHCQIPVTDGRGRPSVEFRQWLPFLERTLELWLEGGQAGRELFVVPEMGPVRGGYNLAQLPNSWEDAKILRRIIDRTWRKALASSRKRGSGKSMS